MVAISRQLAESLKNRQMVGSQVMSVMPALVMQRSGGWLLSFPSPVHADAPMLHESLLPQSNVLGGVAL